MSPQSYTQTTTPRRIAVQFPYSQLTRSCSTLSPISVQSLGFSSNPIPSASVVVESLDLNCNNTRGQSPIPHPFTNTLSPSPSVAPPSEPPQAHAQAKRPITFATIASLAAWMSRPSGSSCPVPLTSPTSVAATATQKSSKTKPLKHHHHHKSKRSSGNGSKVLDWMQ